MLSLPRYCRTELAGWLVDCGCAREAGTDVGMRMDVVL